MSISETFRPTTISGAQVLAWPIIGGKDALFGKSASVDEDVRALQGIGTKLQIPRRHRHRSVGQDDTIAAPLEERDKPPAGRDTRRGVTA